MATRHRPEWSFAALGAIPVPCACVIATRQCRAPGALRAHPIKDPYRGYADAGTRQCLVCTQTLRVFPILHIHGCRMAGPVCPASRVYGAPELLVTRRKGSFPNPYLRFLPRISSQVKAVGIVGETGENSQPAFHVGINVDGVRENGIG